MEQNDLKDRTKKFALNIISITKSFENDLAEQEIAKQLIKSGVSVGLNTRTAFSGRSRKDYISKLETVIDKTDECSFLLELMEHQAGANFEMIDQLKRESEELISIFVSIVKKYNN